MRKPFLPIRMPVLVLLTLFSLMAQARTLQEEKQAEEQANAGTVKLATELHESVTAITVAVKDLYGRDIKGEVVITQFKPDGDGPFPILILNHGRSATNRAASPRFRFTQQARYFVKRGFAVFVPTRIGYGEKGTTPDPEESGSCNNKNYAPMADAASKEILAVLEYAKTQAYVDASRVLIVGQSVGGYSTVAVAAKNPSGLVAAINFAGGSGGNPAERPGEPCQAYKLEKMYGEFGAGVKVPMLWIYTENDQYFAPKHSQEWHAAFVKAGGRAEFKLLPPFAKDGHTLFASGGKIWEPLVSEFLEANGFTKTR